MTIPAYNTYAVRKPIFQPAMRLITAITNGNPAVVTTSFDNQYKTGTIIRLDIPVACGMQQANQQTGTIIVLSSTTFSISIDTTNYDPFVLPVSTNPHIDVGAQAIPIGEDSAMLLAAVQNVLPYRAT